MECLLSEVWITSTSVTVLQAVIFGCISIEGCLPVFCDFLSLEQGQTFSVKSLIVETPGSAGQTVSVSTAW